jgi:hypothetical protein
MARQAGEEGKVRPKKKKEFHDDFARKKERKNNSSNKNDGEKKKNQKQTSAETLQQNRSRRGSKPCCFCYSPSSPSFREYPKNPIPSQKILKLDNPKALECRILAKLFAANRLRYIWPRNLWQSRRASALSFCACVSLSLSLSPLS